MEEKITAFYRAVKKAQTYEQYAQDTEDKESSAHWHYWFFKYIFKYMSYGEEKACISQ